MTKQLIVYRGIPGSGKSRFSSQRTGGVICSADDFFMVDGEYRFDPSKLTEAHQTCFRKFVDAVNSDEPLVVIDNTNIHAAEYAPYVVYAQAFGYEAKIVTVWVALEQAMARQTHGVPNHIMTRMFNDLLNETIPPYMTHEVVHNE